MTGADPYILIAIFFSILLSPLSARDERLRVLSAHFNNDPSTQMMRSYLRGLSEKAFARRTKTYQAVKTADQAKTYIQRVRRVLARGVGQFPSTRTPLNAKVTGHHIRDGYAVENVILESEPGFFVTGNLYLPSTAGSHPGVLLPCGHSENGKAAEPYQRASILLAKNGFVVFCWDPIGQGERKQLIDADGKGIYPSTTEHIITGVAPILLGRNMITHMIWDGMRSIDYLQSRPEVDPERIGCTGISGGGNLTAFLMALDDRIDAAAPGCFITTLRRKNESPGPGDAEQNIFGQIRDGFDHADFILARAPKPTLILAATRDFVPIEGTWEAFREGKRFYTRLGDPERIDLVEGDEKHGFGRPLREGVTRFFCLWLQGRILDVREGDDPIVDDESLRCTPGGQVLLMKGARSIFDLNIETAERFSKERRNLWKSGPSEKALNRVRAISAIRKLEHLPAPEVERKGSVLTHGITAEKLILRPEPGIVIPALLFRPADGGKNGEACLYLNDKGKDADIPAIMRQVEQGRTVLAADVRDTGETRTNMWRYQNAAEFTGPATAEWFMAFMLGKSYLGMRAEDMLICARYLRGKGAPVHLIAHGELGPPALHAAALEPDLFASIQLIGSSRTWEKSVIETPITHNQLTNVVQGALRQYDLNDLALAVSSKLKWSDAPNQP